LNVISVWPNAVPDSTEWRRDHTEGLDMADFCLLSSRWYRADPPEFYREHGDNYWRANVAMMPNKGDKFEAPTVEATLPNEFIDSIAHDVKRMYEWGDLFDPPEDYSPIWGYSKVPATLPVEWHGQEARRLWRKEGWESRFWLSTHRREIGFPFDRSGERLANVPFGYWISESLENEKYYLVLKAHHAFGANETESANVPQWEQTKKWPLPRVKDRVLNVIRYNTGGPQPDSIAMPNIKVIACGPRVDPHMVGRAINQLMDEDIVEFKPPNRFFVP